MDQIPIKEVMHKDVITANGEFTVFQVAEMFKEHSFHHIPIVNDDGGLLGIISLTDIDRVTVGATLFKNPKRDEYTEAVFHTMQAKDLMTTDVTQLKSTDSIAEAYQLFKENKFRAIPILDNGKIEGIITPLDLLAYFFNDK